MSVRSRKWKDPSGKPCERWNVDVRFEHPSGQVERLRKFSPINTRRGAVKVGRMIVRRNVWNGIEGTPKGGSSREVPLPDSAVSALASHRHLKGPYVFCGSKGERLTHLVLKDVVPRICAKAGLPKRLTWHDLRQPPGDARGAAGRGEGAAGPCRRGDDDDLRPPVAKREAGRRAVA